MPDCFGGKLISTGVPLLQGPPAGVKRHLREIAEVIVSKFDSEFARNYSSRDGIRPRFWEKYGPPGRTKS